MKINKFVPMPFSNISDIRAKIKSFFSPPPKRAPETGRPATIMTIQRFLARFWFPPEPAPESTRPGARLYFWAELV